MWYSAYSSFVCCHLRVFESSNMHAVVESPWRYLRVNFTFRFFPTPFPSLPHSKAFKNRGGDFRRLRFVAMHRHAHILFPIFHFHKSTSALGRPNLTIDASIYLQCWEVLMQTGWLSYSPPILLSPGAIFYLRWTKPKCFSCLRQFFFFAFVEERSVCIRRYVHTKRI